MRITHRSMNSFWECLRWAKENPEKTVALISTEGTFEFKFIPTNRELNLAGSKVEILSPATPRSWFYEIFMNATKSKE